MAYRTFGVGPIRGLGLAAAHDLPNLVVIAGPNGAGKSTLLEELHRRVMSTPEPDTDVIWLGPHRGWDQVQVQRNVLFEGNPPPLLESLRQLVTPGMQVGWQLGTIVKTYLVRLHAQQRSARDEFLERLGPDQRVGRDDLPDLFVPFKELVRRLLPHLRFDRVVDDPSGTVSCLMRAADGSGFEFDIELLSSGEKATIALFLPFLEARAKQELGPSPNSAPAVPLTVLIDEVDQHLHPLLQLQVLQYLRDRAAEGAAQFIVTTHSPTLLDAVTDDELYLLSPAALRPGENQLTRLTTSQERLEVARELTGSTHLLTRAKPIVFVEGEPDRRGVSSDAHLIRQLLPPTATWAFVTAHSKTQVVDAVRRLRDDHLELPGIPVFGLVDGDRDDITGADHVIAWPVAMIENLLLDAEAIYQALSPFGAQTRASSVGAVQTALERAAAAGIEDEIRLRIDRHLKHGYLRASAADLDRLDEVAQEQAQAWVAKLRRGALAELQTSARVEVEEVVQTGTQLDRFHGKKILRAVYQALGVDGTLSWAAFPAAVAVHAADRDRTRELTSKALRRITLYFPDGLAESLRASGDETGQAEALANECVTHRNAWLARDGDVPNADGRQQLRRSIFEFARTVDDQDRRERLVRLAAEIGTP